MELLQKSEDYLRFLSCFGTQWEARIKQYGLWWNYYRNPKIIFAFYLDLVLLEKRGTASNYIVGVYFQQKSIHHNKHAFAWFKLEICSIWVLDKKRNVTWKTVQKTEDKFLLSGG